MYPRHDARTTILLATVLRNSKLNAICLSAVREAGPIAMEAAEGRLLAPEPRDVRCVSMRR